MSVCMCVVGFFCGVGLWGRGGKGGDGKREIGGEGTEGEGGGELVIGSVDGWLRRRLAMDNQSLAEVCDGVVSVRRLRHWKMEITGARGRLVSGFISRFIISSG